MQKIYMRWYQGFTEKFYEANVGRYRTFQDIYDSFRVWLVHLSSIKFLTWFYLMSLSYPNVTSDYKYTEFDIIKTTEYNIIKQIES